MLEKPPSGLVSKPARSHFYSQVVRINALRLLWATVIIWGELGAFYWSLRGCRWPASDNQQKGSPEKTSHVLLVSDAQVQHPALQTKRESWGTRFRRFFSDLNLKKSWHVTSQLKPDVIVFLGDMLANGRGAKDDARYSRAAKKFKGIFSHPSKVPVYYVPGNNDIWLGEITPYAKAIRGFYTNSFGPLSQTFDVQNHTFVILDAPGLVDEDYLRAGKGVPFAKWKPLSNGAISFVTDIASNLQREEPQKPTVILSHIPLARPEMANCGPLRERGTIRRNVGHGYQSMLGRQTTSFLLKTLKPLAVFSGDNRDYCEYKHTDAADAHSIREVTLKSFSPSSHIRRPGFQLLSVTSPSSVPHLQPTLADIPCFLPDQFKIYTSLYIPLAFLTAIFLFVLNLRRSRRSRVSSWRPPLLRASSSSSLASLRSVSGRSTPIHQHMLWSPSAAPQSPHGSFPTPLRIPHRFSNSRPGTPAHNSVPESPFSYARTGSFNDDEDEDPMQPAQYAVHRQYDDRDDGSWSDVGRGFGAGGSVGGRDLEEPDYEVVGIENTDSAPADSAPGSPKGLSQFVSAPPAPENVPRSKKSRSLCSYSFVFAGRMRRITIQRPTVAALKDLLELLKGRETKRYRGNPFWATVADILSVGWPPLLVWWAIIWIIS
ncbi:Metallo-dependent phosphatase-like protein [Ephemerocybe angulata]|uniref:Metallo-dependent phosphatase-like protein n=1 Tax=Ephemerocybe angulata TaxID=980116 RepID=A0A8H6I967_9AGAR|nr:Metallo-dependent phosphatase-like protein [Tulosesus angulatus]